MAGKKPMPNAYERTAKSVRRVIEAIDKVDRSFETLARSWYALPKEIRDSNPSLAAWFERQWRNPEGGPSYPDHPLN